MPLPFEYLQQLYSQHSMATNWIPSPNTFYARRLFNSTCLVPFMRIETHWWQCVCRWFVRFSSSFRLLHMPMLIEEKRREEEKEEKHRIGIECKSKSEIYMDIKSIPFRNDKISFALIPFLDRFLAEILSKQIYGEVSWPDILCWHEHCGTPFIRYRIQYLFAFFSFFFFFFHGAGDFCCLANIIIILFCIFIPFRLPLKFYLK